MTGKVGARGMMTCISFIQNPARIRIVEYVVDTTLYLGISIPCSII